MRQVSLLYSYFNCSVRLRNFLSFGVGFVVLLCLTSPANAITSVAGTNLQWSAPATWGGFVPTAGQDILIPAGSNVVIDNYYTPTVGNVVITGKLDITNTALSTLSFGGNLTVNGIMNNLGGIEVTGNNKNFLLNAGATYIHNPRNNTLLDESIFIKMVEIFDPTSYLTISKWFDLSVPLGSPSRVTSIYFGSVTLNVPTPGSRWNQAGLFMDILNNAPRVRGSFTVQDGTVVMDDGTGASSSLILNDVIINATGNIIFHSGQNRPYTLSTGNFTDVSGSALPTILMDSCFSLLIWTVNGNAILGHHFNGIRGSGTEGGGDMRVTINGGLTMNGGNIAFIKMASAPLDLNVIGSTTISGNPSSVSFCDGNAGSINFRTYNFTISGGLNNILLGGNAAIPQPTGIFNMTVNNDLLVNGASTTTLVKSDTSASLKLSVKIVRDLIISGSTNANLTAANSRGAVTVNVTRNLTLTSGKFTGQANVNATGIDSILVGLDFLYNSANAADYFRCNLGKGPAVLKTTGNFAILNSGQGLGQGVEGVSGGTGKMSFLIGGAFTLTSGRFCGIYNNSPTVATGSLIFNVTGAFTMNSGMFRGVDNRRKSNLGVITFNVNSLNFSGGNFNAFQTSSYLASNGIFNIVNNCNISFASTNDSLLFVGLSVIFPDANALVLNLNIGGSLTIGGQNGTFISSIGNAAEIINITGDLNYQNGKNSFNSYPNSVLANAHTVALTVFGNLNVSGGTNYLSAFNESVTATINGNMTITAGTLAVQGGNTAGNLFVKGGYNQSGGTFYLHNNTANASFNPIEVTINSDSNATGDFIHSGGTISFDNNNSGPAFNLFVKSPNVTYSGTGSITRAGAGTATIWGNLIYRYPGTVSFNRSGTHNIQQVRQKIEGTTYFNMVSGYLQVASYVSGPVFDMLSVALTSTLDMHSMQIKSNVQQPNSGISITGRLKTTHPNGIYNGTTNATIDYSGNIYFWLQTNSTVEYNGTDNQIISGVNVGTATLSISRYYNLEINFQGTPDVEFVYPTNTPDLNSVIVRNKLTLTSGELNLDNDHVNTSGGRTLIMTKGNFDMMVRTNGYIRSEVVDGSGLLKWVVGATPGVHLVPFGYASGAANYIPFTFERVGGTSADTLVVSTYRSTVANTPYPPTVTHVHNAGGADNSINTADRFWWVKTGGNATSANMSFIATASETAGIPNLRAQRWIPYVLPMTGGAWELPYQGTQTSLTTGTSIALATGFKNNWWTLTGLANPLPVELTAFTGNCRENHADLKWTTQSEINNSHFTVLRSIDGINYEEAGQVNGAGTVSTPQEYAFQDPSLLEKDITYYMLVQTDYDGRATSYGPVAVHSCFSKRHADLKAYSTGSSSLMILLNSTSDTHYQFRLFDLQGKLIFDNTAPVTEGFNSFAIPHDAIADGIYMLHVTGESDSFTQKVFINTNR